MKKLIILTGINGVGKTTFINKLKLYKYIKIIDSDNYLLMNKGNWRKSDDNIKAIMQSNKCIIQSITQNKSILWETEINHYNIMFIKKIIKKAKLNNFKLIMILITIKNAKLALKRVMQRFKKGGYGTSQINIIEKFNDLNKNVSLIMSLCNETIIFDNTIELTLIYIKKSKIKINKLNKFPWVKKQFNL